MTASVPTRPIPATMTENFDPPNSRSRIRDAILPSTRRIRGVRLAALALSLAGSLQPAPADEAAEQLVKATYKLANASSTASGVALRHADGGEPSPCFLVTAHHVLDQMTGDTCQVISRVARGDGTFERREIRVPIREGGRMLWRRHAEHDLAVLPLPDGVKLEALPLESLATEESLAGVHSGDGVRLAVFPEGSEANGAGFPVLRAGSIASFPILPLRPHPVFLVDTTAWTGDSGGPVMHTTLRSPGGAPLVIGIVAGMRNITDTVRESRFVERSTHHPLGISEVLHAALVRDLVAAPAAPAADDSE